ncbi:N-acetylmuramoyl-L-alanine amidase [Clostridium sp. D53t1_180928_C8]|uniref:N-acetylmuramoyl-L-alanine amidase family protein n=1 Tax=Clostridium sp. D53t1_180928_C8 TaxID=2787101 RepID=UPI0018A9B00A|nr:N-acetylmuramoyl-L-alanine amidase [Clostridium sp. D53t1_180928_C8]
MALSNSNNNFNENALTICIDPGHGDWDDGATGVNGALEKNINLNISLKLGKLLQNSGFNVIYTRDSDNLSLSDDEMENLCERVNISKKNNSDLFISIHCNTTDESPSYKGIETWYNPKDISNENFANLVQTELSNLNYTKNRGIKSDSELVVLNKNDIPSVLVELGFVSNSSDEKFLNSTSGQAQCAEALFTAIKNASEAIYSSVKSDK